MWRMSHNDTRTILYVGPCLWMKQNNKELGLAFLLSWERNSNMMNSVILGHGFHPIFLARFPGFPWPFGTQVPWLSLTYARNESQGLHIFNTNLNSSSFKEIQGENLHTSKEILLMMYAYHKAAFTFEVSLSTPTYDATWMCFNFTHSLMNTVGSIDLHNSLQTFSINIVWHLRTVKGILVLNTTQGKKNVVHLQKRY